MHVDSDLQSIVDSYQRDFEEKKKNFSNLIVSDQKFPIIWFGSLPDYQKSKTKVLTVAINPSSREFEEERTKQTDEKIEWMNNYFESSPYVDWFKSLESGVEQFNASFHRDSGFGNTALHTDFQTGIATEEGWSSLKDYQQTLLSNHNNFEKLFNYLEPDITVLYSKLDAFKEVASMFTQDESEPIILLDSVGKQIDFSTVEMDKDFGAKDINFGVVNHKVNDNGAFRLLLWVKNNAGTNRSYTNFVVSYLKGKDVELNLDAL